MSIIRSKNITKIIIGAVIVFSAAFFSRAAFKIPDAPSNYVSDYANALTLSQAQSLNYILRNYETQTTNQIFIAIFNSLEGESLEDISVRIAERWKPGVKDKDNGVLVLGFLQDRKIRIEVGYGLEGVLTDALSMAVIENEIAPSFRAGDYYSGLQAAVDKMIKIISKDISPQELQQYVHRASGSQSKGKSIFSFIFLILFIIFFIRHPFLALLLFSGGFSSGGRYSGGGFGGGGGGNFGGGGASGGW